MINLEKIAPLLFLFMWSSGAFFVKVGLDFSSVWSFLAIRSLGAFFLISCVFYCLNKKHKSEYFFSKNELLKLCLNGLLLQVFYQSFYFLSIQHSLALGLVALVLGVQPLITPIFSKERTTTKDISLLTIAFLGLFIALFGSKDFNSFNWVGLLFALLAVISITLGSTYQKKIKAPPVFSALVQNAMAAVTFIIISWLTGWEVQWTTEFVISALWMVTVVSTGALLLLFYMISKGSVNKVSSLFYFVPIVTMLFDYLIFQTPMPFLTIVGSCIILISVMIYTKAR